MRFLQKQLDQAHRDATSAWNPVCPCLMQDARTNRSRYAEGILHCRFQKPIPVLVDQDPGLEARHSWLNLSEVEQNGQTERAGYFRRGENRTGLKVQPEQGTAQGVNPHCKQLGG